MLAAQVVSRPVRRLAVLVALPLPGWNADELPPASTLANARSSRPVTSSNRASSRRWGSTGCPQCLGLRRAASTLTRDSHRASHPSIRRVSDSSQPVSSCAAPSVALAISLTPNPQSFEPAGALRLEVDATDAGSVTARARDVETQDPKDTTDERPEAGGNRVRCRHRGAH